MVDIPLSDFRKMAIEEFDTTKLLKHAAQQAAERGYDKFPIIDVDSHHYELESLDQILDYMEDPVLQQLARSASQSGGSKGTGVLPAGVGYQDIGGRVLRYSVRKLEKVPPDTHRDVSLTRRWMDAMGTDIAVIFPSPMLQLGLHPQVEMEVAFARAYNRWLVERVLAEEPRIRSMLYLPFNDPAASFRMVQEFAGKPGVVGFMVTAARYRPVHHNDYMKTYALLEERGLPLAFHAAYNWNDQSMAMMNRFISVHALGFVFYNMVHMTNWIINGLPERFPKLKVIWIESGLAWLPFMIQRLDNEYMMRSSEAPALKKLPGDYIRDMYFTSQPMEITDMGALETTFRMIKAETQLLYSSDYPHWDFDLPSTIYDLPFLTETAKRNILGGNAARLFGLELGSKLAKVA
jgi:predicted TIM-barrel fold metal-dependent hydrolase